MKDDLTGWDFVPEFAGQDAALAIVGEPRTDDPAKLLKAEPVLDLMRRAYEGTRRWFADAPGAGDTAPGGLLVSVQMLAARGRTDAALEAVTGDVRFLTWLRTPMADFDRQTFTREVLARWVREVGASSLYLFAPGLAADDDKPAPEATSVAAHMPAPAPEPGLKKAAMIARYKKLWPTIEADLKEASRPTNKELKAARIAHGIWDPCAALRWAESHGRLASQTGQVRPASPFRGLGE